MKNTFKNFWLLFAQSVTIILAAAMVASAVWFLRARDGGGLLASYRAPAAAAMPSVVSIYRREKGTQPRWRSSASASPAPIDGIGSGVVVSSEGHIVTNYHVVFGADDVEVAPATGAPRAAKILGVDARVDLAVLQVDGRGLSAATMGDDARLQVGDVVLAIGTPFNLPQSVSMGVVSAKGRRLLGVNNRENFIQTDAAINPGSSGGALVSARGELVGISSALFSQQEGYKARDINFAIPVSMVKSAYNRIVADGGFDEFGLRTAPAPPQIFTFAKGDFDKDDGLRVIAKVRAGSPAEAQGARAGDLLLQNEDGEFFLIRGAQALPFSLTPAAE